jgi:hypothetical protein
MSACLTSFDPDNYTGPKRSSTPPPTSDADDEEVNTMVNDNAVDAANSEVDGDKDGSFAEPITPSPERGGMKASRGFPSVVITSIRGARSKDDQPEPGSDEEKSSVVAAEPAQGLRRGLRQR